MVMMNKGLVLMAVGLVSGMGVLTAVPSWARPPLQLVTGEVSVEQLKEDGNRYMQLGFQSLAIESFRGAMELEDKLSTLPSLRDAEVPFNLGLIYLSQGRFKEAHTVFQRSLEADPSNFKTHYQLGLTELKLGNQEAARYHLALLESSVVGDAEMESHLQSLLAVLEPVRPQSSSSRTEDLTVEEAAVPEPSNGQDLVSASGPEAAAVESDADPVPGATLEMLRNRSDR
ncbi:MAG: tetratricopeptide repeat protein [Synechococcaceae cyanobacterium SM2_3_1]|nr:tetratricopeptide repeat protein [Synechococcaceae cyanobacterium SM2_3_1]